MHARSKISQRELLILKTAFPPGQKLLACAWHDGAALPEFAHEGLLGAQMLIVFSI